VGVSIVTYYSTTKQMYEIKMTKISKTLYFLGIRLNKASLLSKLGILLSKNFATL
jgi:endonuclease III